jgi:hypothetical protein
MRIQCVLTVSAIGLILSHSATAQAPTPSFSASVTKPLPTISSARSDWKGCPNVIDVCDVLTQYSSLANFKVIRDNFIEGKVSIDDLSTLKKEKAIEMIERSLFASGFACAA